MRFQAGSGKWFSSSYVHYITLQSAMYPPLSGSSYIFFLWSRNREWESAVLPLSGFELRQCRDFLPRPEHSLSTFTVTVSSLLPGQGETLLLPRLMYPAAVAAPRRRSPLRGRGIVFVGHLVPRWKRWCYIYWSEAGDCSGGKVGSN